MEELLILQIIEEEEVIITVKIAQEYLGIEDMILIDKEVGALEMKEVDIVSEAEAEEAVLIIIEVDSIPYIMKITLQVLLIYPEHHKEVLGVVINVVTIVREAIVEDVVFIIVKEALVA